MLAGVIKAPSQLAPSRHPEAALRRQHTVLATLVEAGELSLQDAAIAEGVPSSVSRNDLNASGGYFADWVYSKVAESLTPGYGAAVVNTTLDLGLQTRAEALIAEAVQGSRATGGPTQAALVAMRRDGSIVAMVGGKDYAASQFNRATIAKRQPGSTFKLFTYLAAFRQGASPWSEVSDSPLTIDGWTPANADHRTHGRLSLEDAFARSSNLAAVRISQVVGLEAVVQAARDLGVTTPIDVVPSLPLGTSGVSLLELTGAYAAVAAGEYPIRATGLDRSNRARSPVTTMDWERKQGPLLYILRSAAERGTGQTSDLPVAVYGKTGTTQNNRDALFVGFAGDLVVGVWVGNDDEAPMRSVSGGVLPARIWRSFMALGEDQRSESSDPQAVPLPMGPPSQQQADSLAAMSHMLEL